MVKRWHIQESLYFEEISKNLFSLVDLVDESCMDLCFEDIDDIINALQRIKAYYEAKELIEVEKEALARWGKAKIPTTCQNIQS